LNEKNFIISITGDKTKIDLKALNKFGKLVEIKESSLFSK